MIEIDPSIYMVFCWLCAGAGIITAIIESRPAEKKKEWNQDVSRIWWPYRIIFYFLLYFLWPIGLIDFLWEVWKRKRDQ